MTKKYSLPWNDMVRCHEMMLAEIADDEDAKELYYDLIESATKYAHYRANWNLWKREVQMKRDESRSMCYDSLIIKFDILARYLEIKEYSAEWRDLLGDIKLDPTYRKRIGDFACYLVFVNSLNTR